MRRFLSLVTLFGLSTAAVFTQQVDVGAQGKATIDQLGRGDFAGVVARFDEKMLAALPEEKLRATWSAVISAAGAFKGTGTPTVTTKGDFRIVSVPGQFERGSTDFQVAYSGTGRIVGLTSRSGTANVPFTDANYVAAGKFVDREVTVDAGGWPLPGTLTLPSGPGPFPAVVLVHGSGPGDRDATIGPNKLFRDLGRGLASQGVAVLRYEKRTRQHQQKVAPLTTLTVKEETIDDAVAAVRLLQKSEGIDPRRVFVLGHSLGGMLAPRIAIAAGADLRGLIILAGAVRPLEQALVEQMRYLALNDGSISADEQRQITEVEAMAAKVKGLKASDPPLVGTLFSAPASYWVDLRGYDPPAAARALKLPMLILQGERDYQVTMEEFARWRTALGTRSDVTLKSYPALNHLFMPGTGRTVPAEYHTANHAAEDVVRDIASWVAKQK